MAEHARKVYGVLRSHGVKDVITIDPHTTNMLRSVYPDLLDGYDLRVRSYLEVLAEREPDVRTPLSGEVAMHDSCVFARYENMVEEPRKLLPQGRHRRSGNRRTPADRPGAAAGRWKSLYPEKAAGKRAASGRAASGGGPTTA